MLILLIARLAALGLRDGPALADADEKVDNSIAAGPVWAGTKGVRARKVIARVTEPNIVVCVVEGVSVDEV